MRGLIAVLWLATGAVAAESGVESAATGIGAEAVPECLASLGADEVPASGTVASWFRAGGSSGWHWKPKLPDGAIACLEAAFGAGEDGITTVDVWRAGSIRRTLRAEDSVPHIVALHESLVACSGAGEPGTFRVVLSPGGKVLGGAVAESGRSNRSVQCVLGLLRKRRFPAGDGPAVAQVELPLANWPAGEPVELGLAAMHWKVKQTRVRRPPPPGKYKPLYADGEKLERYETVKVRVRVLIDERGRVVRNTDSRCRSRGGDPPSVESGWDETSCVQLLSFSELIKGLEDLQSWAGSGVVQGWGKLRFRPLPVPGGVAAYWGHFDVTTSMITFEKDPDVGEPLGRD